MYRDTEKEITPNRKHTLTKFKHNSFIKRGNMPGKLTTFNKGWDQQRKAQRNIRLLKETELF